ncbi:MAG: hypothetical protein ACI9FD_004360, partial [Gammaproteobacteria bacterium]
NAIFQVEELHIVVCMEYYYTDFSITILNQ